MTKKCDQERQDTESIQRTHIHFEEWYAVEAEEWLFRLGLGCSKKNSPTGLDRHLALDRNGDGRTQRQAFFCLIDDSLGNGII